MLEDSYVDEGLIQHDVSDEEMYEQGYAAFDGAPPEDDDDSFLEDEEERSELIKIFGDDYVETEQERRKKRTPDRPSVPTTFSATGKKLSVEEIKQKTYELYASLPVEYDERRARTDIRDQIIDLNYAFFGYVAATTFINNSTISFEDKFNSAVLGFCENDLWMKWCWKGDANHRGYRDDISFTSFFKPRVGECLERYQNEVKYSLRRDLCLKAGKQLGKHWQKVNYEDLSQVTLPADEMMSLKACFGTLAPSADYETQVMYIEAPRQCRSISSIYTDKYDDLETMLVMHMIDTETRLNDRELKKLSAMLTVPYEALKAALPAAEARLYNQLHEIVDLNND